MPAQAPLHIVLVPAWWPTPERPLAGVFFRDYASALASSGIKVGVVYPDLVSLRYWLSARGRPIIPRIMTSVEGETPVVRIRGLHCAFRVPALQMRRFGRWLRRGLRAYAARFGAPDILHAMCAIPSGWACLQLGPPWAQKTVITEHTGPFAELMSPHVGGDFVRQALASAPTVTAVSERLRQDMQQCGVTRDIQVVPNPVGPEFLEPTPPPSNPMAGGQRVFDALFVGRLTLQKGIHELIEAVIRLRGRPTKSIRWHIVGVGPMAGEIRSRLDRASMSDAVKMHGLCNKAQVAALLRNAHFLVHPSHIETGALTVCEALSIGRPAIGTRGTACEEWIGPDDGLLCDPGNTDSLVQAVEQLTRDYDRWDWRAIADRAAQRFGPAVVAERYAALYADLRNQAERRG